MTPLAVDRSLVQHFVGLDDPRCALQRRHKLGDMIVIAIAAVLCGADGWVAIAAFGRAKRTWLGQFLELPTGFRHMIPSGGSSRCWSLRRSRPVFVPGWRQSANAFPGRSLRWMVRPRAARMIEARV